MFNNLTKLYQCKCGNYAKPGNQFLTGHNGRGRIKTPEELEKIRVGMLGKRNAAGYTHTEEWKQAAKISRKGINNRAGKNYHHSETTIAKIQASNVGKKRSPETCIKIGLSKKGFVHSEKTKAVLRKSTTKLWRDSNYAKKVMHRRQKSGPELEFENICREYSLPYRFVGNGQLRVGNRNPDFIHLQQNKLIEIYGEFFHKGDNPQDRIDFSKIWLSMSCILDLRVKRQDCNC